MWTLIQQLWKSIPRQRVYPRTFEGMDELARVRDAALRAQIRSELMLLPADDPALKDADELAWALVRANNLDHLSHAIRNNDYVAHLLEMWSENDDLADEYQALMSVRVMLIANKAKFEIEGGQYVLT